MHILICFNGVLSSIGFLNSFHSFSFFFFNWIITSVLFLSSLIFFCWVCCWIFVALYISFVLFFSSRISVWFHFMISISCCTSYFVHILFSWFHLSVFSCNSLSFFKTIILKLFVRQLTDLHFFGVSFWQFITFLWWHCISLIFGVPCAFAFLSVHLKKQSPLPALRTSFGKERLLPVGGHKGVPWWDMWQHWVWWHIWDIWWCWFGRHTLSSHGFMVPLCL